MSIIHRHHLLSLVAGVLLLGLIAVVGFGVYLADATGSLPWQSDPTRIPITPFAGIANFSAPTAIPTHAVATPTP